MPPLFAWCGLRAALALAEICRVNRPHHNARPCKCPPLGRFFPPRLTLLWQAGVGLARKRRRPSGLTFAGLCQLGPYPAVGCQMLADAHRPLPPIPEHSGRHVIRWGPEARKTPAQVHHTMTLRPHILEPGRNSWQAWRTGSGGCWKANL